jgi:anaerobic selenocysteine-containing dehydrogenase
MVNLIWSGFMAELKTVCRYCCGACGMVAKLDGQGRITALRGDPGHALTDGFACQFHHARLKTV